ncbi:MAG: DNA/RNA nuclease SfsA [Halieaceae bacterium]|jgi:sugar fermentation stimulation protein A|nr:DNA/RNA nuclease SfsA [Halieaceae bacterium]
MLRAVFIPHPQAPLLPARFLVRYDRFIAVVRLDSGEEVEAHCVNPGRMEGLVRPGARAWVSAVPPDSPRKLRYTLELLDIDGVAIGVNTQLPNLLAETLLRQRRLSGLKRYRALEREVPYGERSRIDLRLTTASGLHFIEVKNCHLVYPDGGAYFPDSVSTRAAGHLEELARCAAAGHRATVLFTVQRPDAAFVRPSDLHDPAFAAAARRARAAGVRFRAACFAPTPEGFEYLGERPVRLGAYALEPLRGWRDALLPASGWRRRARKA